MDDPLLPALPPCPEASTASITTEVGNVEVKLTRKARKRKGYEASSRYEERRAHQHRVTSQKRLAQSIGANSLQVSGDNSYALLPKSYNGASGSGGETLKDEIDLLCSNTAYRLTMLKTFRAIPYRQVSYEVILLRPQLTAIFCSRPRSVVHVYSLDKALVALRTFRHSKMDAAYMVDLMRRVDKLATSCRVKEGRKLHHRGQFAQMLIGWNHGMGEAGNVLLLPTFLFLHMGSKVSPRCHTALQFITVIKSILMNFLLQIQSNWQCEPYPQPSGRVLKY
jgi:hypothetical protein